MALETCVILHVEGLVDRRSKSLVMSDTAIEYLLVPNMNWALTQHASLVRCEVVLASPPKEIGDRSQPLMIGTAIPTCTLFQQPSHDRIHDGLILWRLLMSTYADTIRRGFTVAVQSSAPLRRSLSTIHAHG